ncbi:hypothetical protein P153DRAFT_134232 [Dothidotthia symphoricarpi CBS 119687]|uniref:Uncharacterized protein n=1 Tax=Dothidotthia symphoricarpi CBS 119687 TaxID=1392245 RepID=A0A6A5ZZW6_9PLEO|nr:uncharacterized protein P153DRAFT_134232 [Dothidotthia symphoricarpi CBS 119687]KAF2124555.1 hypothetical protein P153DRAFT_134232 [Dothidotthia symphoricarpi CBS 119687]
MDRKSVFTENMFFPYNYKNTIALRGSLAFSSILSYLVLSSIVLFLSLSRFKNIRLPSGFVLSLIDETTSYEWIYCSHFILKLVSTLCQKKLSTAS